MDPKLKKLLEQFQEKMDDLDVIREAVKQLEIGNDNLKRDVMKRIADVRTATYDGRGRYKGRFDSEEQAREFALNIIALTSPLPQQREWALQVLKTDHRTFAQRDITGDEGVIPHEHIARFHSLVEESSVFYRRAYRQPMSSATASFSRRTSGFRARRTKSRTNVTAQDLGVVPVDLTAFDFDVLTSYPENLEVDALIAVAEIIAAEMGFGFSLAIEEDGLIGDSTDAYDGVAGIAKKLGDINGVDNGGGLILATGAAAAGWTGIVKNDILKLIGQARYTRPGQSCLIGSNEFYWQVVAPIVTAAGGATIRETEDGLQMQAFGVPYEVSHVMPRAGGNSQIPLLYGDLWQSSTVGERKSMDVRQNRDVLWLSKQVAVMGTSRWAINNHSLGTATEAGPVVGLITPAAT